MIEVAKKHNLLLRWLVWQFFEMPRYILRTWIGLLKFNLDYFSVPLLLKTFFSHWRRYKWSYGRGFSVGRYLEVLLSNLISRTLGAILRFFVILVGLLTELLIFFIGGIFFLTWIPLPIILIAALRFGL